MFLLPCCNSHVVVFSEPCFPNAAPISLYPEMSSNSTSGHCRHRTKKARTLPLTFRLSPIIIYLLLAAHSCLAYFFLFAKMPRHIVDSVANTAISKRSRTPKRSPSRRSPRPLRIAFTDPKTPYEVQLVLFKRTNYQIHLVRNKEDGRQYIRKYFDAVFAGRVNRTQEDRRSRYPLCALYRAQTLSSIRRDIS
jgi:hypothetical protein